MSQLNALESVELFHLLFLNQLGRSLDRKMFALKGGCNMRFFFQSIRFSEDIDLDVQIIAKDTLRNKVRHILKASSFNQILQTNDIKIVNISEPKQTDTTQRWKIALQKSKSDLFLNTKIEFSRSSFGSNTLNETINSEVLRRYSLMPIITTHYDMAGMFEQKVQALALRSQTQARDIFDLYILNISGKDLKITSQEVLANINLAQENAMSISYADFKGQVVAFLPEDYHQQYDDKLIWDEIVLTVVSSLKRYCNEID